MALGSSTQSLTEMSTKNLPGGKGQPECKAVNFTANCDPIFKMWRLDVSQPYGAYGPSRLITGLLRLVHMSDQFCIRM
jgi:hypothetical protein